MIVIHQFLLYLHIVLGAASLVLFWLPMFSKKGSKAHIKLGKVYANAMYMVAISGIIMCVMVLIDPITIRFQSNTLSPEKLQRAVFNARVMASFLLALSLLVLVSVKHGLLVLKAKQNRAKLKTWSHLLFIASLAITGLIVLFIGIKYSNPLLIIFGLICTWSSASIIHYIFKPVIKQREWIVEHFAGLIGSGIGVYTAFFAVGGRHLLTDILPGYWQLLPWVLPGIVGTIYIAIQQKQITQQFKIQ